MIKAGIQAIGYGFLVFIWLVQWIMGIFVGMFLIAGILVGVLELFNKAREETARQTKRLSWQQMGVAVGAIVLLSIPIVMLVLNIPLPERIKLIFLFIVGWSWFIIPVLLIQVIAMLTALLWTHKVIKRTNALLVR